MFGGVGRGIALSNRVSQYLLSRSEQAPGKEFHPSDKSEQVDCDVLGPSWCNKKVNPET